MRKLISLMHVSLDGFVAGPLSTLNTWHQLDWANVSGEVQSYVDDLLKTVDMAIYGRTVYEMMAGYWPTVPADSSSTKHDIDHAHWVENVAKVVFSRTLDKAEWNNTTLIKDNIVEATARLKQQQGGDMMIFGSPSIVQLFTQAGLIDDFRINVNPVALGSGLPMFRDQVKLKLVEARTFP